METKKISFSFSKVSKRPNLLPTKENAKKETKLELIKCLEGQEIKLVEEKQEQKPLVIPLKDSQKTSAGLASLMKRRAVLLGEDVLEETKNKLVEGSITLNNGEPEDIEKRAARELLTEIQKNISSDTSNNLVLPVVKPDDLPLEGAKESTLDDYENIPITDFGKALLRGMGWTEPLSNTSRVGGPPPDESPMVRPKGMGLGAETALRKKTLLVAPDVNEVLEIKRNAFVRILGGKFKDLYGQIEGFDDHAGIVIIKLAIGGTKEAFNEFLCQPVSRKEYAQYGKCINSSKYEEYKKKENEFGQITIDKPYEKKEKNIKKEGYDATNDQNKQDEYDYKRRGRYDGKKEIKRENDIIKKEENRRGDDYEYMSQSRDIDRIHREKYDESNLRTRHHKDDTRYIRREEGRYVLKTETDHSHLKSYIKEERGQNIRDCERSSNGDRVREREHSRPQYRKDYSSDSESDSNSNRQKISKKIHSRKKSKKSKKSKSKYNGSTDSETTCSTNSLFNDEQKTKKHKKKTKKSKKQRERSRSRGRR